MPVEKRPVNRRLVLFQRGPGGSKYGHAHTDRATEAGLRSAKLRETLAPPHSLSVDRRHPLSIRQ